ncbi:MAG: SpoIIE family protein phosphatase [Hungatella sp.]|nr:SpoIIE family protein phosphatase [Hungatella sp.]
MADSLEELAKTLDEERGGGRSLSREDGLAALQMAGAMVCGDCSKCNLYSDSEREDSYYLYYLLRAFEQKGNVEFDDMPRLFRETCGRQADYVGQLNRNLGRATMNLTWKNRFLESRDTVITQFRELAVILEEFARQMEQASDVTAAAEPAVRRAFYKQHMVIDHMLMLEYDNKRREAFVTVKTNNGRCVMAKDAAELLGQVLKGRPWTVAKDSRAIINRQFSAIHFVEEGGYRVMWGAARASKSDETVSGDNFTCSCHVPGQAVISLSDGMGSGEEAARESRRVVELAEQLLAAGYTPRAVLKLVNTVLLLAGEEQHPATVDLCCIDLYTGVLEVMKLGAVATYLVTEAGVELLEAAQAPAGVLGQVEPVLLSRKLWEDNWVIMVSDGVLEALPGEDKEQVMREYLEDIPDMAPQELADRILEFAMSFSRDNRDDMTVLAAEVWKKPSA